MALAGVPKIAGRSSRSGGARIVLGSLFQDGIDRLSRDDAPPEDLNRLQFPKPEQFV
jgi:hypothetical protein